MGRRGRPRRRPDAARRRAGPARQPSRHLRGRRRGARRRDSAARREGARTPPALKAAAGHARARPVLDEHGARRRRPPPRDRGTAVEARRDELPRARARRRRAARRRAPAGRGRAAAVARRARDRQDARACARSSARGDRGVRPTTSLDPEQFLAGTSYLMEVATARRAADDPAWRLARARGRRRAHVGVGALAAPARACRACSTSPTGCSARARRARPARHDERAARARCTPPSHRPGRCLGDGRVRAVRRRPRRRPGSAARGVEREVARPMPLAELYEAAEGREPVRERSVSFGFAPRG